MIDLSPQRFFDLSSYSHATLFENVQFAWDPLKKIKDYLQNCSLGKIETHVSENAYLVYPELISIGSETIVEPGAYIRGPCIIGKKCTIRHGAYIRGNTIIGDNCIVGHDTEVKNSIFLDKAQASHFAYIGDCILGNGVNLGAGTKCANLKLDRTHVFLYLEKKKIDTGLRKFGAIIGDYAQLGCNCVSNPGTLMGKESLSYPCMAFGGLIPENHIVKSSHKVKTVLRN